eukprot:10693192-Alexandrium_andersonii.AAC.1
MGSETGLTSQKPQDSMNRISSERAAATSSGGRTAPVMSPRSCGAPLPAPWPPEHSGRAGSRLLACKCHEVRNDRNVRV